MRKKTIRSATEELEPSGPVVVPTNHSSQLAKREPSSWASLIQQMADVPDSTQSTPKERIVAKLLEMAERGEKWAVECVLDRMDGKPKTRDPVDVQGTAKNIVNIERVIINSRSKEPEPKTIEITQESDAKGHQEAVKSGKLLAQQAYLDSALQAHKEKRERERQAEEALKQAQELIEQATKPVTNEATA